MSRTIEIKPISVEFIDKVYSSKQFSMYLRRSL